MKWICTSCKAINPQFSYRCHGCGLEIETLIQEVGVQTYKFKLTRDQKEAIYSAIARAPFDDRIHTKTLYEITSNLDSEVTLTDEQVSAVLQHIEGAIEHYENLGDDWLRAADYRKTREYLIAETRKQFKVVK